MIEGKYEAMLMREKQKKGESAYASSVVRKKSK